MQRTFCTVLGTVLLCALIGCGDDMDAETSNSTASNGSTTSNGTVVGTGSNGTATPTMTIYVDATSPAGGNGSAALPYASLDEAFAHPEMFDTVQLAEGTYSAPTAHTFNSSVAIKGADTRSTFIQKGEGEEAVWESQTSLSLDNMTLFVPLFLRGEGTVSLSGLEVSGPTSQLHIEGSTMLAVSMVSFQSTGGFSLTEVAQASVSNMTMTNVSTGFQATDVGTLTLESSSVSGAVGTGIRLTRVDATLRDVSVEDVTADPDAVADSGDGIVVLEGSLDYQGGTVADVADRALVLTNVTAQLSGLASSGARRSLLSVQTGSIVTASNLTYTTTGGPGAIFVGGEGSSIDLSDSSISDAALGLLTSDGVQVTARNNMFMNCPGGHISLLGESTGGTFTGNVFMGSQESCFNTAGGRVPLVIRGNTFMDCVGAAISTLVADGIVIDDNTIDGITPESLFQLADAISAVDSSNLQITMNRVTNADGKGVAFLRSSGRIEGNTVTDVGDAGINAVEPFEVEGEPNARLIIKNNTITRATSAGISIFTVSADIEDNHVSETALDAEVGLGDGIVFALGADATIRGNTLEQNEINGILFDGATGVIEDNEIRNHTWYGIRQFCTEESAVTIGDNVFMDNVVDDILLCE